MRFITPRMIKRRRKRLQSISHQISLYAYPEANPKVDVALRVNNENVDTNLHALTEKIRGDE